MYTIEIEKKVVTVEKTTQEVSLSQFVGHRIKTVREALGLSQTEFVKKISEGVSITHFKNIENGLDTTRLRDLEMFAKALDVEVASFFLPPSPEVIL